TDRMTVADQTAARVDWNLERRFGFFWTHLRQRCRPAFHEVYALTRLGQAENFVGDNFCDRKTIMNLGAVKITRRQVRHSEGFLRRFGRDRKRWRIFFVERQIISRVTVAKQPDGF